MLYWECTHGCKVFFEYPPYGKLIAHKCKKRTGKKILNRYPVIVKKPKGLLEKASLSCPICGKLFKSETDLKNHLKHSEQYKKSDPNFSKTEDLIHIFNQNNPNRAHNQNTNQYKPLFGKINIKRRKT
ncbi:MAG: hypothetical protein ACFFAO_13340 [Candidatus Hermodarchaeota archaeon]